MKWAMLQPVRPATHKFVLVALANCADKESNEAWPSTAELVDVTGLDRKTVLVALERLNAAGFAVDRGKRRGRTGQVKVFHLPVGTVPNLASLQAPDAPETQAFNGADNGIVKPVDNSSNDTENGTGGDDGKDPVFPIKGSQFSHVTVPFFPCNDPKNGIRNQSGTNQEPVIEPSAPAVAKNEGDWYRWWKDVHGIESDPGNTTQRLNFRPLVRAWMNVGVTFAQMQAAVEKSHKTAKTTIAFLPAYAWATLQGMQADEARAAARPAKPNANAAAFAALTGQADHHPEDVIDVDANEIRQPHALR